MDPTTHGILSGSFFAVVMPVEQFEQERQRFRRSVVAAARTFVAQTDDRASFDELIEAVETYQGFIERSKPVPDGCDVVVTRRGNEPPVVDCGTF
jgi:hypothetical protein